MFEHNGGHFTEEFISTKYLTLGPTCEWITNEHHWWNQPWIPANTKTFPLCQGRASASAPQEDKNWTVHSVQPRSRILIKNSQAEDVRCAMFIQPLGRTIFSSVSKCRRFFVDSPNLQQSADPTVVRVTSRRTFPKLFLWRVCRSKTLLRMPTLHSSPSVPRSIHTGDELDFVLNWGNEFNVSSTQFGTNSNSWLVWIGLQLPQLCRSNVRGHLTQPSPTWIPRRQCGRQQPASVACNLIMCWSWAAFNNNGGRNIDSWLTSFPAHQYAIFCAEDSTRHCQSGHRVTFPASQWQQNCL